MPIRELTERPQIPRLGKVRLGDRSGRNGAPVNRPFFVVPEEVQAVYGKEPTQLTIVFLSDDPEVIASSYYRAYNATNGLFCKGDGFRANALLDAAQLRKSGGDATQPLHPDAWAHGATSGRTGTKAEDVSRREIDCPGKGYDGKPACPLFATKKCAVRSYFQFAIKDVPGLGVYQMDTGSVINTMRMNGAIELCRLMLGGVAGVPMTLSRVQAEVSPDGVQKKVWTVDLKVATEHSLANLLEFRDGPVARALMPPIDETEVYEAPEDDEAIEGDYRETPPTQDAGPGDTGTASEQEGASPPPPAGGTISMQQYGVLAEWLDSIKSKHGAAVFASTLNSLRQTWPYAASEGKGMSLMKVLASDFDAVVAALKAVHDAKGKQEPKSEAAPEHEHEWAFNEDTTLMVCQCGETQEEPPSSDEAPIAAGLGI